MDPGGTVEGERLGGARPPQMESSPEGGELHFVLNKVLFTSLQKVPTPIFLLHEYQSGSLSAQLLKLYMSLFLNIFLIFIAV